MSWEEKAEDYAVAHHTYEHMTPDKNAHGEGMFVRGARWQRDQLLTEEALDRLAAHLYQQDYEEPIEEHPWWCVHENCEVPDSYRNDARAAITALLGES